MYTDEIVKLTRKRVIALLEARRRAERLANGDTLPLTERREHIRWPFKSPVEIWPAGGDGSLSMLGSCMNMSESGMGLSCGEMLDPGAELEVAVHLPEVTMCGRATVRYCAQVRHHFVAGLEFQF